MRHGHQLPEPLRGYRQPGSRPKKGGGLDCLLWPSLRVGGQREAPIRAGESPVVRVYSWNPAPDQSTPNIIKTLQIPRACTRTEEGHDLPPARTLPACTLWPQRASRSCMEGRREKQKVAAGGAWVRAAAGATPNFLREDSPQLGPFRGCDSFPGPFRDLGLHEGSRGSVNHRMELERGE